MAGRLSRGWSMAKVSFAVLRQYPKLAVLPAISGAVFLLVAGAILASLMPQLGSAHNATGSIWNWLGDGQSGNIWFYLSAFAVLFVLTAVAIFFNVALIHCALRAHAGEQPSIRDGLAAAVGLLPQILGWALITTTIGVVLNMITDALKNYLGFLGSLFGGLLELFLGRHHLFRRAGAGDREGRADHGSQALRGDPPQQVGRVPRRRGPHRTPGHAVLRARGIGVLRRSGDRAAYGAAGMAGLGPILVVLGVLAGIATMVVMQTLSTIFQSGVYLYATTGQVPPSLDRALVEGAFRPKA
jgi:hypothetical protein